MCLMALICFTSCGRVQDIIINITILISLAEERIFLEMCYIEIMKLLISFITHL
jgi:hypothetical protein